MKKYGPETSDAKAFTVFDCSCFDQMTVGTASASGR
jgi:hypothetical protein